jgi:DNA (cytosine-5)-methyltransferase 1
MRYLSVCSGIEAATVAWHPLGWSPVAFSEIEKFPCAVLAHHYPTVPNWGDMTKFKEWPDAAIDVLVGGTPCQSFSVAGLRAGLADPRGNLALTYLAIADRYRPRWVVWENVPGVLSSVSHTAPDACPPSLPLDLERDGQEVDVEDEYDADEQHALWCFLSGLSELGYGFAYGTLDAQYFGLAQRRKRVFVVGHLGDWRRAAAVLFERESLSGHPAPRREARQTAPTIPSRSTAGGGLGTDFDCDGGLISSHDIARPLLGQANSSHRADAESYIGVASPLSLCLNAGKMGRLDAESETLIPIVGSFDVAGTLNASGKAAGSATQQDAEAGLLVPYTLAIRGRGDSHDLEFRQDGKANAILTPNGGRADIGVGAVGVPIPIDMRQASRGATMTNNRAEGSSGGAPGTGIGDAGDPAPTIASSHVPAIAFTSKDHGGDSSADLSPTLRVGGHGGGAVMPAIAFDGRQSDVLQYGDKSGPLDTDAHSVAVAIRTAQTLSNGHGFNDETPYTLDRAQGQAVAFKPSHYTRDKDGAPSDIAPPLTKETDRGDQEAVLFSGMAVRRLTPRECERLQGFPDDYTLIPYRGKPVADGPRYKALGNSMAVPVMRWIGERIALVEEVCAELAEKTA